MMVCGAACLIVPLVVPRHIAAYLFVLVWLGFILLLDPLNRRLRLPSFLGDLSDGFARRLYGFLASGWICGWLWEFWNNWAHGEMALHVSDVPADEDLRDARARLSRLYSFCPGMLRNVRYRLLARRLAEESEMTNAHRGHLHSVGLCAILIAAFVAPSARATGITLPPKATQALDKIYSGDPDAAIGSQMKWKQRNPITRSDI